MVDELLRATAPCDDDDLKIAYFVLHILMTGQERAPMYDGVPIGDDVPQTGAAGARRWAGPQP